MASARSRVQSALLNRLSFFGRTAQAMRSRIEQRFKGQAATEDYYAGLTSDSPAAPVTRVAAVPSGLCLYAIGDIHGRRDLLERLMEQIAEDAAKLPADVKPQVVFLGDYIDRGLQSKDVINYFISGDLERFDPIYLMGNHEEALLRFLNEATFGSQWTRYGGAETL